MSRVVGCSGGKRESGFVENDIPKHEKFIGFQVIEEVTFNAFPITKEDRFSGTRLKFGSMILESGGKGKTSKDSEV